MTAINIDVRSSWLLLSAVLLIGLWSAVPAHAQHVRRVAFAPGQAVAAAQWEVVDVAFTAGEVRGGDPFGVALDVLVEAPDGRALRVPAFYDGDSTYVFRFSADTTGTWRWTTASEVASLAGLEGRFEVTPHDRPGRRGALTVADQDLQAFAYEDGTPAPVMATEIDWLFALDLEAPGDSLEKTGPLLDQLREAGFNQVIFNVYAHDVSWEKDPALPARYDYGSPAVWPFGGSNSEPDHARLNPAFFQHLDRVVAALHEREMSAHLMIYVWNKQVNWPEPGSEADDRYFDHVVARYQAFPNLVWDVSKEALAYGRDDVGYIDGRIDRLRRRDAFGRLVTVHDYSYCSKRPGKVDFISVQSWAAGLHHAMRAVRDRHSSKPVLNVENGCYAPGPYLVFYNGDYRDAEVCLVRSYETLFAGVYTSYYWQDMAWNVIVHDFADLPAGQGPRLEYHRHLAGLQKRYALDRLTPTAQYSSSGYGLAHPDLKHLLLWVPAENRRIALTLPEDRRSVRTTWFRPLRGTYHGEEMRHLGSWHSIDVPWPDEPAILIVEPADSPETTKGR